jgi:Ca2+-transporting ATPase
MDDSKIYPSIPWHSIDTEKALKKQAVDSKNGLSQQEAKQRLNRYGFNVLKERKKIAWYQLFAKQFTDILVIILIVAMVIAFVLGEAEDGIAIAIIIVLNSVLGFTQEWKAEKAMEALKRMLSLTCKTVREGVEQEIDSALLVPGDIILLEIGDKVPADVRLLESVNLKIDESALTGESASVSKVVKSLAIHTPLAARKSMGFMGTVVTNGYAKGLVVHTNMETEFGKIAHLTETVRKEVTPLQRKLNSLGKQLGWFAISISVFAALLGFVKGQSLLAMFFLGLSLAVAVVPEGLPAVVTLTMALGIRAMAKRKALFRRLRSVETLGSVTVICTDKTGTLTQNEMTLSKIWLPTGMIDVTGGGYDTTGHFESAGKKIDPQSKEELIDLLKTGAICNHAKLVKSEGNWYPIGEPTEAAFIVAAKKAWLEASELPKPISEFSFNSARKRMTVITRNATHLIAHVKGAPEVILHRCAYMQEGAKKRAIEATDREVLLKEVNRMGEQGLRTLAVARRALPLDAALKEDHIEKDLVLLGLVGIIDPPRAEVPEAIRVARKAGIRTIMITGDAVSTALAIAHRIGILAKRAITGMELEKMSDQALQQSLKEDIVFARVEPDHKLRIVQLLQSEGEVVGMTGDGVNDAPALKKADIGISMGIRGTDVAKEASDVILTDDNFSSIINAVKEGRRQYDNITKFVQFLLSSNIGEIVAILLNILLFNANLILLPVQILWINLVTDSFIALALGVEPADSAIMDRKPRPLKSPIMGKISIWSVLILGGYIGATTFGFYWYYQRVGSLAAQTIAFTGIIVLEIVNVFNFRSFKKPLFKLGFFSNPWILGACFFTLGLQIVVSYLPQFQRILHIAPLSWHHWGIILVFSIPIWVVAELGKWIWRRVQ